MKCGGAWKGVGVTTPTWDGWEQGWLLREVVLEVNCDSKQISG